MNFDQQILNVGAAFAAGLLIGIERGWKLRDEPDGMRVAGIRTFTLLGLLTGIAGLMAQGSLALAGGALLIGAIGIVLIGYARAVDREGKPDATTSVAALVTIALGFAAGAGYPALAIAGSTIMTLTLALRAELHGFLQRLDEADIKALARYAVIAGAVYPFLPDRRYGPYDAWDPHTLWLVVIAVTGFSFVGYVANRLFGVRRGTIATAIIGGAYSSTAVTYSFAQRLGAGNGGGAENAGIVLASTVMYLRVLILVGAIATPLLVPFAMLVIPPMLATLAISLLLYRRAQPDSQPVMPGNPIAMLPAFTFVAFVAVAAVVARWGESQFGEQGIAVLLLLMGAMDVDAAIVTAGGLEPGAITPALAALALAGTILANMAVKLGATVAYGGRQAKPAVLALSTSMAVLAGSLAVGWFRL
ncbi:MgtC/SapB family protein [Tsuneonella suprasediminis]|uniref:MgtC/SapB family protein n=1 Tax=Tsuneonella suprasediminis TaxID=2306996 RepID=UPI002F934E96